MADPNNPFLSRRNWLGLMSTASVGSGMLAANAFGAEPSASSAGADKNSGARIYNIRDFGARGDGVTADTAAVQAAIDACNKDQGGTVLVPAGVFVIGTVELKSNVTLHLAAAGKLLGSPDGTHYRRAEAIPLGGEWTMGDGNVGLIFAADAENVTIEGNGTIDGNGVALRGTVRGQTPPNGLGGNRRPHHLLFYQCRNLTVRDIFLTAGAYHSVRVCLCSHVKLDGIHIHSRVTGNNDGFHFISSRHVHVSNCDVQCGDDACALFGSNQFVTVTNCSFSTRWSVFRFGGGESENIAVSNCIIYETYGCPIKMRCASGSRFENISFSNIVMKDVTGPISIGLGPQHPRPDAPPEKPGIVRNISFNGIHAVVSRPRRFADAPYPASQNPGEMFSCVILNGMDAGFLENISFNDVHVTFPGGGTAEHAAVRNVPKIAGEYYAIGVPPAHGLFARNVRGLTLNSVRFETAGPDLRPAVVFDHVEDAAVNGFSAQGTKEAEALLRFIETRDVLLTASRVLAPAAVFLQVEGAASGGITIDGGDLSKAAAPLTLKADVPGAAVKLRN
jgi:hypothetical protein